MTDDARWFVGVDWASQAHQACLIDAGGKIIGEQAFAHGGAGLAELCTWLLAKTGAAPTAIAVACTMLTREAVFDPEHAATGQPHKARAHPFVNEGGTTVINCPGR